MDFSSIEPVSREPFTFGPKQTAWLEALESGKYAQGRHLLKNGNSYCCLGVLCELDQLKYDAESGEFEHGETLHNQFLPGDYWESVGLRGNAGNLKREVTWKDAEGLTDTIEALTDANDGAGWSFKDIAAYVRHDPHNVFTKSV